jgi:hypothetical protein
MNGAGVGRRPTTGPPPPPFLTPPLQGPPLQGPPLQGPPLQGPPLQGSPLQGPPLQGPPLQGPPLDSRPATIEPHGRFQSVPEARKPRLPNPVASQRGIHTNLRPASSSVAHHLLHFHHRLLLPPPLHVLAYYALWKCLEWTRPRQTSPRHLLVHHHHFLLQSSWESLLTLLRPQSRSQQPRTVSHVRKLCGRFSGWQDQGKDGRGSWASLRS